MDGDDMIHEPFVIQDETQHKAALAAIETLMDSNDPNDEWRLQGLAVAVEKYERDHYSIGPKPTLFERVKFRIDQMLNHMLEPKYPAVLKFAAWLIMRIPGSKISNATIGDYGKHYHTRHIKMSAVIYPLDDDETYGYIGFYLGRGSFLYWFDKPFKSYNDEEEVESDK